MLRFFLLAFSLVFTLTGCNNKATPPKPLGEEDFRFEYNSAEITENTEAEEIESKLGFGADFDANNNGYISSGGGAIRWQAAYPNSDDVECRMVFLTTASDTTYLVFAQLNNVSTNRGVKAGDSYEKLFEMYGEPQSKLTPYEGYETYRYTLNEKYIDFVIDNDANSIDYIVIDYRSYQADQDQSYESL
ncbi:hypothetical protein [Paenibacillus fonticola]|uniref:hypothetical protein n=1 Tax=Paenibacillus fonticola TaxID=379896 RepID=UPI000371A37D|nr:hypothetical protein [Paenibacillus fonticola]